MNDAMPTTKCKQEIAVGLPWNQFSRQTFVKRNEEGKGYVCTRERVVFQKWGRGSLVTELSALV